MGATIIEKHVGKTTDEISLNGYSCTVEQMEKVVDEIQFYETAFKGEFSESEALKQLKRGVFARLELNSVTPFVKKTFTTSNAITRRMS